MCDFVLNVASKDKATKRSILYNALLSFQNINRFFSPKIGVRIKNVFIWFFGVIQGAHFGEHLVF